MTYFYLASMYLHHIGLLSVAFISLDSIYDAGLRLLWAKISSILAISVGDMMIQTS